MKAPDTWLLPGILLFVAACGAPVYSRSGIAALNSDGGGDIVVSAETGGTASGGGSGTGGSTVGSGGVVGSGGSGSGGAMGAGTGGSRTGGANTGGSTTGGAGVGGMGTGGAGTGGTRTGGAGTGGAGTGGAGTGGAGTGGTGTGGTGTGGTGTGGTGTGGTGTGGTGTGGAGTGGAAPADSAKYNFEASNQGWTMAGGAMFTTVARSTAQHFAGTASLGGTVTAASGTTYILEIAPPTPAIPAGAVVTFHVYVPIAAVLSSIQPYVLETGTFRFTGSRILAANITRGAWTTVNVNVPADAAVILRLGVQFVSTGAWTDTVYVDSVSW